MAENVTASRGSVWVELLLGALSSRLVILGVEWVVEAILGVVGRVWRFAHWPSGAAAIVNTIRAGGLSNACFLT
jgi:hypothetical protein